ncbi:MAG: DUF1737 domain-containing protein [Pseudomonadota bacterium]
MRLYRMITGTDDDQFCHRVSKALSNGWELAGSASLTFDAVRSRTMCGQPVTKDVPDEDYREDMKLGEY